MTEPLTLAHRFHPDVLAAHAEFGGDLESMQALYDRPDHLALITRLRDANKALTAERDEARQSWSEAVRLYEQEVARVDPLLAKLAKVEAEREQAIKTLFTEIRRADSLSAELAEARKRAEKMHRRAQEGERANDALKSSMALWDEVANDKRGETDQFNYGMRFAIREIRLDVERALRRSFLASKEPGQ